MGENNDFIEQYKKGLGLFYDIGVSLKDSQMNISNELSFANGLGFKIYNHFISILKIASEYNTDIIDNKRTFLIDNSSLAILTRASFETYLTFNHIFIQSTDSNEQMFRFDCWDLAGYIDRSKYSFVPKSQIERLNNEKKQIEELKDKIQASPFFISLNKDSTKNLLNGKWRGNKSWVTLAVEAGFNKKIINDQYSNLCSQAHSSRISISDALNTIDIEKQKQIANATIGIALMIMAKFINDFHSLIQIPDKVYENNQEALNILLNWKEVAENVNYDIVNKNKL